MFEELMKAINGGNPTVAEEIVEKINQEAIEQNKGTDWLKSLSTAAGRNQNIVFHKLFAKVNQQVIGVKDENNKNILHIAAEKGYDKIVAEIINMNQKLVDAMDNSKMTPLHYQAKADGNNLNPKVIKLLLSKMSDKAIDAADIKGNTALHYHGQIANTNLETVNLLLSKMSKKAVDLADNEGNTVFHYMMKHTTNQDIGEITQLIISKASSSTISAVANDKTTALNHLSKNNNIKETLDHPITKTFIIKMNQQAIGSTIKSINERFDKIIEANYPTYHHNVQRQQMNEQRQKEIGKLTTCCSELITENPNDAELYLKRSNILFSIGKNEEGQKCYDKGQKLKNEGGHVATTISQAKVVDVDFSGAEDKKQDYSASKITKLIKKQLKDDLISITSADVERGKLPASEIEAILRIVKEEGKIIVPLRIKDDAWAGIVIIRDGEHGLKIIYNDPSGEGYAKVKNVKSLINTLMSSAQKVEKIDLHYKQEGSASDSSALIVDNLTVLAKKEITDLNQPALKTLLTPEGITISQIKMKHSLIVDNNHWYSEFKLLKLLEIKLKEESVTIASFDLENKEKISSKIEELISNITTGQKSAAAVPLHLHGKDWASLVIKQNFEEENTEIADGLKIIYNDSRGISLNKEIEVKKFIAKICKIIGEIKVFDLQEKQHEDENDSAVFAVENLSILSKRDTADLNKSGLKELMKNGFIDEGSNPKDVDFLRNEHIELLSAEIGIDISQYIPLAGDHDSSS